MIQKTGIIAICCLILFTSYAQAGMDQFLRNSLYSIQSAKDDGALTLVETKKDTHKLVKLEKWNDLDTQKWDVRGKFTQNNMMDEDFQSIGLYDFTPLICNTSANIVTYQLTKNVYTHKRQWKVHLISLQRYQIQNPESGLCLTNMGMNQQVDEIDCDSRNPLNQVWKLRMLKKQ